MKKQPKKEAPKKAPEAKKAKFNANQRAAARLFVEMTTFSKPKAVTK